MPVGAGFIPARIGENKKMTEHKKLQPEIRFAGFTDDWEQRKLGELADIRRGASPRPIQDEKWFDKNSKIGWLRISDVTEQNGRIHFIEQKLSFAGQEKTLVLNEPHLILSITATIGKPVINYVPTGIHDGFIVFLNLKTDMEFLFQWLEIFRPQWQKLGQSGSQVNINSELVRDQIITLPKSKEEQTQIGNFFKQLDDTIALHQRTLEKYQKLKISYLEKMFPKENELYPELRFPNFTDAWEQRKLGDVFGKIRNAFVGTATPYYVTSGHFYLESNNIKNGQINRDSEIFINEYFYQKQKDKWLKSGDMVMVQSGHVGHTAIIPDELHNSIAHALIMFTDYLDKSVPYFFNFFFQTNKAKREIDKITTGNTVKHILASDMKDFPIFLPSYEEQTQIGNFFKQLDDTIALHQREVEKYKKIKQSYLEKMFI